MRESHVCMIFKFLPWWLASLPQFFCSPLTPRVASSTARHVACFCNPHISVASRKCQSATTGLLISLDFDLQCEQTKKENGSLPIALSPNLSNNSARFTLPLLRLLLVTLPQSFHPLLAHLCIPCVEGRQVRTLNYR